jgi:hypothetical protein
VSARVPFEYAVVRVVPRVERGEYINAGVILFCRERDFLGARAQLDADRLRSLDAHADVESITAALHSLTQTCAGTHGPAAGEEIGRRFRWLTAPRSTVVQPGPVHTGLTDDPQAELDRLVDVLVRAVPS